MKVPICPECSREARTTMTRYGRRHSCCNLWSWEGAPLVDGATHEARQAAHDAFDPLWKCHGIGRREAYEALAEELGIPFRDCHMKSMDRTTAEAVPEAVHRIRDYIFA